MFRILVLGLIPEIYQKTVNFNIYATTSTYLEPELRKKIAFITSMLEF